MTTRVLLTGATGFLGGSILDRLVKHSKRDTFKLTILVRSSTKAEKFKAFGVDVIVGSLEDLELLEGLASESDIIIQAANADHLPGTEALLLGCKKRFEATGISPAYIHTSGSALMLDDAEGRFLSDKVNSDLDVAMFDALPETAIHHNVDLVVVKASEQGYVKGYLAVIPLLWGLASNDFVTQGLQKCISAGVYLQSGLIMDKGHGRLVGEGKNAWVHLNIEDAAAFYLALFDAIIGGKNPAYGREGYYAPENGHVSQLRMIKAIVDVLHEHGGIATNELITWPKEELDQIPMIKMFGSNAILRGDRARSLGWEPVKGTDVFVVEVKEEIGYWLRELVHSPVEIPSFAAGA